MNELASNATLDTRASRP